MSWSEAAVEMSKYLAASGLVGVIGVVTTTISNQRHELKKEMLLDDRLRERDWREFQKTTIVELQDTMWELLEAIQNIGFEREIIRLGLKSPLALQDTADLAQHKLRRVEVLTARIEDDELRDTCERLRATIYLALKLINDSSRAKEMDDHVSKFTVGYNQFFRVEVRRVLQDIIHRPHSDILTT